MEGEVNINGIYPPCKPALNGRRCERCGSKLQSPCPGVPLAERWGPNATELTDAQIARQDSVDDAILSTVSSSLIPVEYLSRAADLGDGTRGLEWDIEWISEVRDMMLEILVEKLGIEPEERDLFEMTFHPYLIE